MSQMSRMAQMIRSSGRLFRAVLQNPSVQHCWECTNRLILTNVIVLRESEKVLFRRVLSRFSRSGRKMQQLLMGACLFSWAEDKITDEEMASSLNLILDTPAASVPEGPEPPRESAPSAEPSGLRDASELSAVPAAEENWQEIVTRPDFRLWRRPLERSEKEELFEYRVHGRIDDVPGRAFLAVQLDLQYRRFWDNKVVQLEVVDEMAEGDSELVHWVTKFPYPMANREYVYVRRCRLDPASNSAVVFARSLPEHPLVPEDKSVVRVTRYESIMVIKAHSDLDSDGFDYYMKYHDDPKASFPSFAYKWMATHGLPAFLEDVHRAAVILHSQQAGSKAYS